MGRLILQVPFGVGAAGLFNHFSRGSTEALRKAAAMGLRLQRCAGNTFICQSTKDFWQVRGNKIVRLVGNEIDSGDRLTAAPQDNPAGFLEDILGDLTF
jgi:hypothetical protein